MDRLLEIIELRHHLVVDLQPAGCIDDDDAVACALRGVDATLGNAHDIVCRAIGIHGDVELSAERFELIDGGRAIYVSGDEARGLSFRLELSRELGRGRRLSRALESNHHNDGRRDRTELERLAPLTEHRGELVVDNLDELLRWRNGAKLGDADGSLLDPLEKFAGELKVDIGF